MDDGAGTSLLGLRDAGRQVLASLAEIGHTRLELAIVELEEERLRLARQWVAATCALFLLFVGIVLTSALIVLACEPAYRLPALALLSALFLALAAAAVLRWRRLAAGKPPLLHATLGELAKDRRGLFGRDAP